MLERAFAVDAPDGREAQVTENLTAAALLATCSSPLLADTFPIT